MSEAEIPPSQRRMRNALAAGFRPRVYLRRGAVALLFGALLIEWGGPRFIEAWGSWVRELWGMGSSQTLDGFLDRVWVGSIYFFSLAAGALILALLLSLASARLSGPTASSQSLSSSAVAGIEREIVGASARVWLLLSMALVTGVVLVLISRLAGVVRTVDASPTALPLFWANSVQHFMVVAGLLALALSAFEELQARHRWKQLLYMSREEARKEAQQSSKPETPRGGG